MSRYKYQGVMKDGNGKVIGEGSISVFEAGTSTPADVYTASSGGVSVNSVTGDTSGYFFFWLDDGDYSVGDRFKITISKVNFQAKSYDDISMLY